MFRFTIRRPASRRRTLIGGLAVLAAVMVAAPVAARTPVDPGTLNPAPPDFFNAQCFAGAGGTVCSLAFTDDPIIDEPSGIVCDGVEILFSQDRSVVGKRFYDANGNLTQRHFRESMNGTYTNPSTRLVVPWLQHDTIIHDLSVPGDLSTGTVKITGLLTRAWVPGGGTFLADVGTVVRDQATDETIFSGGKHPFEAYFVNGDVSALQPLCDALDEG